MSDTEEEEESLRKFVKITLVGEPASGKSCLCSRYRGDGGVVGGAGAVGTQGAEVSAAQWGGAALRLCDVAGAALHSDMLRNYLYDSDIVIFVYDLTNLQSFEKLTDWIKAVKDIFDVESKKPLMALFGNKSDLEHQRAVRLSCVQKFASEHLLENFKGSARSGEMVNTAFTNLIARVLGKKAPLEGAPYKKNQDNQVTDQISTPPLMQDPANSLIMSRKMLRKVQRKASSSVCRIQ
ncbi:ras-related protein Rab-28-like [Vanessa atalanta]|uniref:ras-related protein Rab-28-like n=1 Tax=Vanessa atalanta TaxID=42275 RepID=UPI001FCD8E76|nr:ras-related protein Rab-28-like [Vanessa atalanta]